jgi:hypothetical protein
MQDNHWYDWLILLLPPLVTREWLLSRPTNAWHTWHRYGVYGIAWPAVIVWPRSGPSGELGARKDNSESRDGVSEWALVKGLGSGHVLCFLEGF